MAGSVTEPAVTASLEAIRADIDALSGAMLAVARTQARHTEMLASLLQIASEPAGSDTDLVALLERILGALDTQTRVLQGVETAVTGLTGSTSIARP